ncbi:hypothetical protein FRC17_007339, partial [Serendipita sp. 399]
AIVFEICNYLDIFSLVSLSEVNQSLRSLANSRSSFWLETLSTCELIVPLKGPTPLHERNATELNIAAHRAAMIERNLTSPQAKLHSYRYVPWPFEPSSAAAKEWEGIITSEGVMNETPREAIKMHLVDESGEWMILVSARNIIRILHLRTGKVAAIFDELYYTTEALLNGATFEWGVEFFHTDAGQHRARMVMSCVVPDDSDSEEHKIIPGLALLDIVLDASRSLATVKLIKYKTLSAFCLMADVAGPFVVTIVPEDGDTTLGKVSMYRWIDWTPIKLPKVYAQVVPYPYKSCNEMTPEGSQLSEEQITELLSRPLPLQSFHIQYDSPLYYHGRLPLFRVCHRYTGQRYSTVRLWIRPSGQGIYKIFAFTFDLVDLTTRAAKVAAAVARGGGGEGEEEEGDDRELVRRFIAPQELKRVLQEENLKHYAVSTASGRRYLWWRPVSNSVSPSDTPFTIFPPSSSSEEEEKEKDGEEEEEEGEKAIETFQLWTSNTDELAPLYQMQVDGLVMMPNYRLATGDGTGTDDGTGTGTTTYAAGSPSARQLAGCRRLPVPASLACMKEDLFLFLLVEWCGTAVVQLTNGTFWVLRYGKA